MCRKLREAAAANQPLHLTRRLYGFSGFNVSPAAAQVNGSFGGVGTSAMKRYPTLLCLVLAGCGMQTSPNIVTFDEVTGPGDGDRLVLRLVEVPAATSGRAFDFHSVVWEVRDGDAWAARLAITQADFQRGAVRRRWVSALHGLDPDGGVAILQVGEEQPPDARGVVRVEYSWREWDLFNNREVRVLRVCQSSFENVDGTARRVSPPPP
jgi:hypothetical protein